MKPSGKPNGTQFNLPLLTEPAAVLPSDKQRELALALVELLVGAARESGGDPAPGGGDESKTDQ
jgi:hypothetical protein